MDQLTRCLDSLTEQRTRGWARHLPWIGVAATSLTAFTFGLRSLSYNSLVLLGLLVAAIGVSLILRGADLGGGVVIAVGWWVVFLGKPTSALALAVVGAIALFLARRVTLRGTAAAVGGLLVAVTVTLVAIRMTPNDAVSFLAGGVRQDQLLGGHVSLLPLVGLASSPLAALLFFGLPLALAAAVAGELARRRGGWVAASRRSGPGRPGVGWHRSGCGAQPGRARPGPADPALRARPGRPRRVVGGPRGIRPQQEGRLAASRSP